MIENAKVSYPAYLTNDSVDLLQKLLMRRPSERLSCHDALRHPFFKKNGLNIDEEEEAEMQDLKQQSLKNLTETIRSAERKIQPKILSDSDMFVPDPSQMMPYSDQKPKKVSGNYTENKADDTLELSQSVFLSNSQILAALENVVCLNSETREGKEV